MTADDTTAETATATPAVTEIVDAPHARALHRIVCLYSTKGLQLPERTGEAASEVLELGRFAGHYRARSGDIPWVAERGPIAPRDVHWKGDPAKDAHVENLRAWTIRLRGGRVMLALGFDFDGPLSGAIPLLGETCFNRETLEVDVDGSPLALFDALLAVAPAPGLRRDEGAGFDRDVHQILSAAAGAGELLEPGTSGAPASPNKERLARYVYRSDEEFRLDYAAFRVPHELNRGVESAAAHGRGVTVLSGIAEPVESAVILTAAQLLGAASAVREIRERAVETLDTLSALESTRPSPTTRRTVLAALSNELSAMHTKLSFEVESQVDAVHVPEIVIEQYQASLAGTLGLATAADTTSRMLDRLTAAIAAASEALERRERESDDDRRFRVTLALTVASLVAVPVTVLFAFYGVNATEVPATNSLWDTSYWPAWVAVGGAFALSVIGVLALWLIRSRRGAAFDADTARGLDFARERVASLAPPGAAADAAPAPQPQVRT